MTRTPFSLAAALALLLVGCAPQAGPPAGGPQEDGNPKQGGQLKLRLGTEPADWDVTYSGYCNSCSPVIEQTYNTMIGFKAGPDIRYDEFILQPELAERWEVSTDASTYTFHLRKGVQFAPIPPVNARELTSSDVKWTVEYLTRSGEFKDKKLPPYAYSWMFEGLDSVEAPDPYTAVVRFKQPFAPFASYAASSDNPIMPREIYEQEGSLQNRMAGTGPFWHDTNASQRGAKHVLKKHPSYWSAGKPHLDELQFLVIPETSTAAAAFQTKQLDIFEVQGVQPAEELRRAAPQATVREVLRPGPVHMYMNTRVAPFNDVRVRRAVSLALDRDEFLKTLFSGKGGWALAGAFPDTFSQEEVRQILRYDPTEAKRLLTEAGHANGVDVEFNYAQEGNPEDYLASIQLLQSQLKKVGINLNFKTGDRPTYLAKRRQGDFVLNTTAKAVQGDVDSYVFAVFHPRSAANYGGVNDPELTALLEAQRGEPDPVKRREQVRSAVRLIHDKALQLALYSSPNYWFWQPHLKNYGPNFLGNGIVESWLER